MNQSYSHFGLRNGNYTVDITGVSGQAGKMVFREQPLILHIPHSSRAIPADQLDRYLVSPDELETEMDNLVDYDTEKLFRPIAESDDQLTFPWSRFFMDVERFENDEEEPMAAKGMGVFYESTTDGRPLRRPFQAAEREELLNTWYRPWHNRLEETVDEHILEYGSAFIIDGHSFPDIPLPCDADQTPGQPDICLGTDEFHTSEALVSWSVGFFEAEGYSVEVNRPYVGTMVPLSLYGNDRRVVSLMVEVNRRLYGPGVEGSERTYAVIERFLGAVRGMVGTHTND